MALLALLRTPADRESASTQLAQAAGIARAEAQMRLAAQPPALLLRDAEARLEPIAAGLRTLGWALLVMDERAPNQRTNLTVRSFKLGQAEGQFRSRAGEELTVPWNTVSAILVAHRSSGSRSETTKTEWTIDAKALITMLPSKKTTTLRTGQSEIERLILVYQRNGPVLSLSEQGIEFTGLGPKLQPVRLANMLALAAALRQAAPQALYDERLLRLGNRQLPLGSAVDTRLTGGKSTTIHHSTASTVEVLGELMTRGFEAGLFP